jgi:hypothetical protein
MIPAAMSRKSKTQHLTDSIIGQHLALSVAAHLARTQLVSDPLAVYDAQHLTEMIDIVGAAIAKVAPLYVQDPGSGTLRPLTESELEGATVKRSATNVVLRDGRTLSSVSIKRVDLRQAIAILKAVGIPELQPPRPVEEARARAPEPMAAPLETLAEIERLLRPPLVPAQIERANRLAVNIARSAPHGRIANLAMQLMSAVHEASRGNGADEARVDLAMARLRAALSEAEKAKS